MQAGGPDMAWLGLTIQYHAYLSNNTHIHDIGPHDPRNSYSKYAHRHKIIKKEIFKAYVL